MIGGLTIGAEHMHAVHCRIAIVKGIRPKGKKMAQEIEKGLNQKKKESCWLSDCVVGKRQMEAKRSIARWGDEVELRAVKEKNCFCRLMLALSGVIPAKAGTQEPSGSPPSRG